jgi:hypothetical protein
MQEEREPNTLHQKKPYIKPTVQQVALRPEEAVLGNCKSGSSSGPAQAFCTVPSGCSTSGS